MVEKDGLGVLGIFVEGGKEHKGFECMASKLAATPYAGDVTDMENDFNPMDLLPGECFILLFIE